MDPTTMINAVSIIQKGLELFLDFKSIKSPNEKDAVLSITGYLEGNLGQLFRLSLTNLTNKPFSIVSLFSYGKEQTVEMCPIREMYCEFLGSGKPYSIAFRSDSFKCDVESECTKYYDFSFFDTRAFLQPYQAETGWIIIPGRKKVLEGISGIGLIISSIPEIIKVDLSQKL